MKTKSPCEFRKRRFLQTDYFFHSDMGGWRGYWSTPDDEGESAQRRFYEFTREFLREAARERAKEMYVFRLLVLTAAWPVGYMAASVVNLLPKRHQLDSRPLPRATRCLQHTACAFGPAAAVGRK